MSEQVQRCDGCFCEIIIDDTWLTQTLCDDCDEASYKRRLAELTEAADAKAQIAALTAERDALLAACKAVEWVEYWDGGVSCPQCGHGFRLDHNPNCQLAAAIAMAEVAK